MMTRRRRRGGSKGGLLTLRQTRLVVVVVVEGKSDKIKTPTSAVAVARGGRECRRRAACRG